MQTLLSLANVTRRPEYGIPLCALLTAALVVQGFFLPAPPAAASALDKLTSEDIFRGLILAHGPVADLIPEIRDNYRVANFVSDPDQLHLIVDLQDRLIVAVQKAAPGFIDEFSAVMRSSDHLAISEALAAAASVTSAAIARLPEVAELRRAAAADPEIAATIIDEIRASEGGSEIAQADLEFAVNLVLAEALDGGGGDQPSLASLVVVLVAVAAIVAAITVVAALAYAVAANIASAVNVAAAVVAWVRVVRPSAHNLAAGELLREEAFVAATAKLRVEESALLTNGLGVTLLTWSVIALEAILFAGLFMDHRHRAPLLKAAFLFHLAIWIVHGLFSFGVAMAGALVIYLRPIDQPFQPDRWRVGRRLQSLFRRPGALRAPEPVG